MHERPFPLVPGSVQYSGQKHKINDSDPIDFKIPVGLSGGVHVLLHSLLHISTKSLPKIDRAIIISNTSLAPSYDVVHRIGIGGNRGEHEFVAAVVQLQSVYVERGVSGYDVE